MHYGLKGGVFKPVAATFGKFPAMIAAFAYSGLFHEWLLVSLFANLPDDPPKANVPVAYGSALIFFLWNAVLVGLEMILGSKRWVKSVTKRLPRPAKTLSILLAGVPVAHYFTQPYIHSDFFAHGNIGFPFVRKQSPQ